LVEFYAPWCGHCKSLAPNYAEAATQLKKQSPPIPLGKVDATVETAVAGRFGISGYPTLKIFRRGVASDYQGPRDTKGIVSYMLKQEGPSAKPLKTIEDAKNFINGPQVSVVGIFPSKSGSAYDNFLKTADNLREEFKLALITESSIADSLKLGEGVFVIHNFGETKIAYTGSHSASALGDWINDVSVPTVGEFSKDTQNKYKKKNLPILKVYIDVDYKSNLKRTNYYLNRLKKAAEDKDLSKKLLFAIVDREDFKDELEQFGLGNKDGVFAIDDHTNNQKFKGTTDFGVENLQKFAKDFIGGKLKSYIKSEPVPAPAAKGTVTTVVGETFSDIVLDNSKDVLIELYAPWCGHCKKLVPIYDELAASLKDVENVVIAKMDATANDAPHGKYQAKGYPTIFFAPAGSKDEPIPYNGERDVKGFTEFLKKNSSTWKVAKTEL